MAFNLSVLLKGAQTVASHPATKGGALAALITGGLYVASAAGVLVPGWAFVAGPVLGTLLYKLLPAADEQIIDGVVQKVTDTISEIPDQVQETYPADKVTGVTTGSNPNA